jgi:hypothetical protein
MRLFFIKLWLSWLMGLFLVRLGITFLYHRRAALYWILLTGGLVFTSLAHPDKTNPTILFEHPDTTLISQEFNFWQQAVMMQPTHRDLLINAAILTELLDATQAAHYWETARYQDPNHPIFRR